MEDASELSVRVIEATQTFLSVEMSREKRAREKVISGIDSMSKAVEELKKGLDVSGSGSGRESSEIGDPKRESSLSLTNVEILITQQR